MDVQALGKAMKLDDKKHGPRNMDQVTFKMTGHEPKKKQHLLYFCFYLFFAELREKCHFREELFVQMKNVRCQCFNV